METMDQSSTAWPLCPWYGCTQPCHNIPFPRPFCPIGVGKQMYGWGSCRLNQWNHFFLSWKFNDVVWGLVAQRLSPFATSPDPYFFTFASVTFSSFSLQTFLTVNLVLSCALRRLVYAMVLGTTPAFVMIIKNTPLGIVMV